ncbi:hypothetical protein [Rothia nasimurium]|uniref:hypothetical protein n=1 Tax=Rothia nasimurium TaxID=85336 RepID=UPI001F3FD3C1|nr:hypothetical protein [Rothia nasimurium]
MNAMNELLEIFDVSKIFCVSVNESYQENMELDDLLEGARGDWAVSLSSVQDSELLIAIYKGKPVGVWDVFGAYITDSLTDRPVNRGFRVRLDARNPKVISPRVIEWFCKNEIQLRSGSATIKSA